jgi:hypothetical protein
MTATIEKRIEALENDEAAADQNLRVIIAEPGETADQARSREGIEPDADNVLVVVFG